MNSNFLKLTFYSLVIFFGIRWFFASKNVDKNNLFEKRLDLAGQEFRAPVSRLESMPLQREVELDDSEKCVEHGAVVLYTKNCDYSFSTRGAVLTGVEFKRHKDQHGQAVRNSYPQSFVERDGGSFLLAFNEKTPMSYHVEAQGQDEAAGKSWVTFKAENSVARVTKTFTVNDQNYLVELKLKIQPKKGALQPRILFAGPSLNNLAEDKNSAFVLDVEGKNLVVPDKDKEENFGWKLPKIFGAEDQYFVNALVGSSDFVQRAFLKRVNPQELLCFVEGPEISETTETTLNFYVGTKSLEALRAGDEKLVNLLNFGFMSLICEWMIKILEYLASLCGNYGLAIILLALFYRLLLSPITFFIRRRFKDALDFEEEHEGEIRAINKQFKDDWAKKTDALDKFYRKYGRSSMQKSINIVSILFVLPTFLAAYKIFSGYINFYHAPFAFWIRDLSARDPFVVLPILFGIAAILKEAVTGDSGQQGFSWGKLIMPMFLVLIFRSWPAGLVLFMLSDSVFTTVETALYDTVLAKR